MTEAIGSSFIPRRAKYYYQEMMYVNSLDTTVPVFMESVFMMAQLGVIKHDMIDGMWYHAG